MGSKKEKYTTTAIKLADELIKKYKLGYADLILCYAQKVVEKRIAQALKKIK